MLKALKYLKICGIVCRSGTCTQALNERLEKISSIYPLLMTQQWFHPCILKQMQFESFDTKASPSAAKKKKVYFKKHVIKLTMLKEQKSDAEKKIEIDNQCSFSAHNFKEEFKHELNSSARKQKNVKLPPLCRPKSLHNDTNNSRSESLKTVISNEHTCVFEDTSVSNRISEPLSFSKLIPELNSGKISPEVMLKDESKPPPLESIKVKNDQKQVCTTNKKKTHKKRRIFVVKNASRNHKNEVKKLLTKQTTKNDKSVFELAEQLKQRHCQEENNIEEDECHSSYNFDGELELGFRLSEDGEEVDEDEVEVGQIFDMSQLTIIELDESDNHNQNPFKLQDKELKIQNDCEGLFETNTKKSSKSIIQKHSIIFDPDKQSSVILGRES